MERLHRVAGHVVQRRVAVRSALTARKSVSGIGKHAGVDGSGGGGGDSDGSGAPGQQPVLRSVHLHEVSVAGWVGVGEARSDGRASGLWLRLCSAREPMLRECSVPYSSINIAELRIVERSRIASASEHLLDQSLPQAADKPEVQLRLTLELVAALGEAPLAGDRIIAYAELSAAAPLGAWLRRLNVTTRREFPPCVAIQTAEHAHSLLRRLSTAK
eukprot:SAG11_NODE_5744_length_1473_cov_1.846434_2_plen_216_part_00